MLRVTKRSTSGGIILFYRATSCIFKCPRFAKKKGIIICMMVLGKVYHGYKNLLEK